MSEATGCSVYLAASGDVLAVAAEFEGHTTPSLATAQVENANIATKVSGGPAELVPKSFAETYHQKTSGDGTQLGDYMLLTDLAVLKTRRALETDHKTLALLAAGWTYATKQFSLSLGAQANWLGVKAAGAADPALVGYPYPVPTLVNGDYYEAADEAEMITMAEAAMARKTYIVEGGAKLKKQLVDAVDVDAVNLVADTRV